MEKYIVISLQTERDEDIERSINFMKVEIENNWGYSKDEYTIKVIED